MPKNTFVSVVNAILDTLIKGLGVDLAVSAAIVEAPFLGLPVIKDIFRWIIGMFADNLDTNLKVNVDIIIIRLQNDARKAEYDKAMEPIRAGNPSETDIQNARDAINRIVSRSKP